MVTDLKHSKRWNTFRSAIDIMNSSSPADDTKEKEKVRKRKYRALMSNKDKELVRQKDRERKAAKKLSKKLEKNVENQDEDNSTEAEKNRKYRARIRAKAAKRLHKKLENTTEDEDDNDNEKLPLWVQNEAEKNRMNMAKIRAQRNPEEVEYDNIEALLRMREVRAKRDGKQHLLDNLKAKRGMRAARENAKSERATMRKEETMVRTKKNTYDCDIWFNYWRKNPESKKIMWQRLPHIAEVHTKADAVDAEKKRKAKEEEAKKEAERFKEGYWEYLPDMDDYIWVGEGPEPPTDEFRFEAPTEEDNLAYDKQREAWLEAEMEERRKEKNAQMKEWRKQNADKMKAYRRKKKLALQEELDKPIEMPELEKSEYELIRDEVIRERNEAMKAAGILD